MSRLNVAGWALTTAGSLLWLYGYLVGGHATLVRWPDVLPAWLAAYVPNLETEVGLAVMVLAMVPAYWPKR